MPNADLKPYQDASSFRRIAAAAWDNMYDATIYGQLEVNAEPIEKWIAEAREKTGKKITLTVCVARALGIILARHPDINATVRNRKLYVRQSADVFLQVALPSTDPTRLGKTDLTGMCVRTVNEKSVSELTDEIRGSAKRLRSGDDKEFKKTKGLVEILPAFLLRWLLKVVIFLQHDLNIAVPGQPKDAFGSAMVTSVGMFGARVGYAPFFPLARVPIILCLGAVTDQPVVKDGKVVAGRVFNIQATMDHRIVDGYHAGMVSKELTQLLQNPEGLGEP
jgi:pyruvate/2-oxoglutarate dehydrogenase complex dihydrolipoamide acyltransferase (E2) component